MEELTVQRQGQAELFNPPEETLEGVLGIGASESLSVANMHDIDMHACVCIHASGGRMGVGDICLSAEARTKRFVHDVLTVLSRDEAPQL